MDPEHLALLVRRALQNQLSQSEATDALCWVYAGGFDIPEVEALLLPIAGDAGLAAALAAQNRVEVAHERARDDAFEAVGQPPSVATGSRRALPSPLRFYLDAERGVGDRSGWSTTVHPVAKAAAPTAAPRGGRLARLYDAESDATLELGVFPGDGAEFVVELAVLDAAGAPVRVAVYAQSDGGKLMYSDVLTEHAERLRLPVGAYVIELSVRSPERTVVLAVPLQLAAEERD
jgi:hypothetical protein